MKLVFTTPGETLDSPLDPSFGRARNFLLYDAQTKELLFIVPDEASYDDMERLRFREKRLNEVISPSLPLRTFQ